MKYEDGGSRREMRQKMCIVLRTEMRLESEVNHKVNRKVVREPLKSWTVAWQVGEWVAVGADDGPVEVLLRVGEAIRRYVVH
jgi:hypothetical protein